jgi:hypothetical protein
MKLSENLSGSGRIFKIFPFSCPKSNTYTLQNLKFLSQLVPINRLMGTYRDISCIVGIIAIFAVYITSRQSENYRRKLENDFSIIY